MVLYSFGVYLDDGFFSVVLQLSLHLEFDAAQFFWTVRLIGAIYIPVAIVDV